MLLCLISLDCLFLTFDLKLTSFICVKKVRRHHGDTILWPPGCDKETVYAKPSALFWTCVFPGWDKNNIICTAPGLPVQISLMVSVDLKQHWTMLRHWSRVGGETSFYFPEFFIVQFSFAFSLPGPSLTPFTSTSCLPPSRPPRSSSSSSAPPSPWFSSASAWRGVRRRRHWVSTTHERWRSPRCWWPSAVYTSSAPCRLSRRWEQCGDLKSHSLWPERHEGESCVVIWKIIVNDQNSVVIWRVIVYDQNVTKVTAAWWFEES